MEKPKALNHMLSFCKITLASRIFQRNNYFPLFRVLTPKDARRRLLRKLQGPLEHYIPVLMNHKRREKLSKGKRVKLAVGYGKRPHKLEDDLRYVCLKWDMDNDKHKRICNLLKSKRRLKGKFVYEIYERDTGLVVTGQMEDALRDGDICDLMISDFSDKLIVRLKNGDKATVAIEDWEGPMSFLEGEGATTKDTEDKHHYGKATMGLAQIYEMKEKGADDDELERLQNAAKKRAKMHAVDIDPDVLVKKEMKVVLDNLDYADDFEDEFEKEMKKKMKKAKDKAKGKEEETVEEGEVGERDLEKLIPEESTQMNVNNMESTTNVSEKLLEGGIHVIKSLPLVTEINEAIKGMGEGKQEKVSEVSGVTVKIGDTERFLVGQMVNTAGGEIFVPGQTINTEDGPKYMPGITVNIDDTPTLFGGLVMANDFGEAVFLPGQAVITEDGQLELGSEDGPIQPTGMQAMDIELDVNDVNEEDEERKIARKLREEEERREKEEKMRQEEEKRRVEEERKERERVAKEQKDKEDREWAKLGAPERAKKERLRIEREKRELEKQKKAEAEREKLEKERQAKEAEERIRLRQEREEIERKRMERIREEKKERAKEAARKKAEKEQAAKQKAEDAKKDAEAKASAAKRAKEDEEHEQRLKELAEFVPKEIPRKEIIIDVEREQADKDFKMNFMKEEQQRMARIRELKRKPIKKIEIPKIKKYEPLPPVVISDKLRELQELIHNGNFFNDHKKYIPTLTVKLKVKFQKNAFASNISEFKQFSKDSRLKYFKKMHYL